VSKVTSWSEKLVQGVPEGRGMCLECPEDMLDAGAMARSDLTVVCGPVGDCRSKEVTSEQGLGPE
jgi:hypothetical protein